LLAQPALRRRMGQAARLRVEQEFTWPIVAMRTASLYKSLLAMHATSQQLEGVAGVDQRL
jgi:glycosyltransferase involved in cell wall biosynthesis